MIKKLLATTLTIAGFFSAAEAQIPNPGFETWGSTFSQPQEPTGWMSGNLFASPLLTFPNPNPNPTSVTKETGAGAYNTSSAKITTIVLQYNPDPTSIPDTLGILAIGSANLSLQITQGFPYTARPNQLNFFAKYSPSGVDTAYAYIELTRWNGTSKDLIADGSVMIQSTSSYLQKTINLTYYNSNFPDTCFIAFSSSSDVAPKLGSTLWVDDLSFSGWNSVNDNNPLAEFVKAYPNPAKDNFYLEVDIADAKEVQVFDMIGNYVCSYTLINQQTSIPVSALSNGFYLYSIIDEKGNVMLTDKFSVVK